MDRTGRLLVTVGITLAVCAAAYLVAAVGLGLFEDPDSNRVTYTIGDDGELIEIEDQAGLVSRGTGLSPEEEDALAAKRAAEAAKPQFEPSEGVYGVVTDGNGNAIGKARVSVIQAPARFQQWTPIPPSIATAITNEKGEFLVGPAPEDVPLIVRAEAAGFAPTNQYIDRRGTRVDLVLDLGGKLEVRVLDGESKPVSGAKVMHSVGWGWNSILSSASTGEEGTVAFRSVPTGSGNLVVVAEGHAAVRVGDVAVSPKETEERTIVLENALQIEGKVVDAKTELPIEGAKVALHYPNLAVLEPTTGAETDADGVFKILADVTIGEKIEIRVTKAEYAESRFQQDIQERADITIKMNVPGEPIEGFILGPDRRGVSGATVTWSGFPNDEVPEVTSASDGSFELTPPAWLSNGANVLAISTEHGTTTKWIQIPKQDGPRPAPVEITLPGAGSIEGTITGKDGNPVEGALISLAIDHQETRNRLGPQINPWQINNLLQDRSRFNFTAISDSAGRFVIDGVPSLAYRVLAKFGLDQARSEEAVLVEAGGVARAEITLQSGGTIEGFVLDADEKPVAGAYVNAWPQDQRAQGWGLPQPYGRTQSDGHFVLRGVEDYDYTVNVSAGGHGATNEQNVRQGETDLRLTVVKLGWIVGVVEGTSGTPHRGTFLIHTTRKRENNNNRNRNRWWGGNNAQTFNTDDGTFTIRGRPEGEYTVRASTRDGLISVQQETVRVVNGRASREVTLRLNEGAVLQGRVLRESDGTPIKNAYVYVSARQGDAGQDNSGATSGNSRSDAKGVYEIKGLGGGAYLVNVWHNNMNWNVPIDLQTGERRQLDLVRKQPGEIEVRVVDTEGKALDAVWPMVKSETGQMVQPNWSLMRSEGLMGNGPNAWNEATRTNADGLIVRYHIPPGRYQVTGNKNGYANEGEADWIEVAGASTTAVTIVMKKL